MLSFRIIFTITISAAPAERVRLDGAVPRVGAWSGLCFERVN